MFDVVMAGQRSSTLGTAYRIAARSRSTNHSSPSPSPRLQQRLAKGHANADASFTPHSETQRYVFRRDISYQLSVSINKQSVWGSPTYYLMLLFSF